MDTQVEVKDWREFLSRIPSKSVDLVLTDHPYESLLRWKGIGTTSRMGLGIKGSGSDNPDKFYPTIPNADLVHLLAELYRVLRSNRHCYVMCDGHTLPYIFQAVKGPWNPNQNAVPFSNLKLLIWDKVNIGMGYHYRGRHEFIVMLDKGKNRKLNDLGTPDILSFKPDAEKFYPTQKPLALFETLILQSSNPGELVIDPFVGGGTTAPACARNGRRFLGADIQQRDVEITIQRLDEQGR